MGPYWFSVVCVFYLCFALPQLFQECSGPSYAIVNSFGWERYQVVQATKEGSEGNVEKRIKLDLTEQILKDGSLLSM